MTKTTEQYELTNIAVETLGLVSQGANKEDFFILKSDNTEGETNAETTEQVSQKSEQEVQPDPTPVSDTHTEKSSLWQKILKALKRVMDDDMKDEMESEMESEEEEDEEKKKTAKATTEEEEVTEPIAETNTETTKSDDTTSEQTTEPTETEKALPQEETSMSENIFTEVEKADLIARLEKAETELAKERERRELEGYVVKARTEYAAVPVSPEELGAQLFALQKSDAKAFEFWSGLLKSVDAIVTDAQLFMEKGSAFVDESDPVLKATQSGKDIKEILLGLSAKDQAAYVKQMQNAVRGR